MSLSKVVGKFMPLNRGRSNGAYESHNQLEPGIWGCFPPHFASQRIAGTSGFTSLAFPNERTVNLTFLAVVCKPSG